MVGSLLVHHYKAGAVVLEPSAPTLVASLLVVDLAVVIEILHALPGVNGGPTRTQPLYAVRCRLGDRLLGSHALRGLMWGRWQ
jgi:hypothetical protein